MNRLIVRAISDHGMKGAYLATAPNPVSNAEFMRALRRVLRAPFGLPTARWMVRLGAPWIMRTDPEKEWHTDSRFRKQGTRVYLVGGARHHSDDDLPRRSAPPPA